jgi:hypothetical protein
MREHDIRTWPRQQPCHIRTPDPAGSTVRQRGFAVPAPSSRSATRVMQWKIAGFSTESFQGASRRARFMTLAGPTRIASGFPDFVGHFELPSRDLSGLAGSGMAKLGTRV